MHELSFTGEYMKELGTFPYPLLLNLEHKSCNEEDKEMEDEEKEADSDFDMLEQELENIRNE